MQKPIGDACEGVALKYRGVCILLLMMLVTNSSVAQSKMQQASKVAILYSESLLLHDAGRQHPENPARLAAVVDYLKTDQALSVHITWPTFKLATHEMLKLAHTDDYISLVEHEIKALKKSYG